MIKEYFANYFLHSSDVMIDARNNKRDYLQTNAEPWRVTLVDTGESSMTGGRLQAASRNISTPARPSASPMATAWPASISASSSISINSHGQTGDPVRRHPARPLWRTEAGRRQGHGIR